VLQEAVWAQKCQERLRWLNREMLPRVPTQDLQSYLGHDTARELCGALHSTTLRPGLYYRTGAQPHGDLVAVLPDGAGSYAMYSLAHDGTPLRSSPRLVTDLKSTSGAQPVCIAGLCFIA
jgi:hypothetical protein